MQASIYNISDIINIAVPVYGYGMLAVFIISLCAALGLVLVRARNTSCDQYLFAVMLGLGAGTLAADAFLHLIPHVSRLIRTSERES